MYLLHISVTGVRRVNVIMRRGGAALQQHLEKVINLSKLVDKYAKDLDERGKYFFTVLSLFNGVFFMRDYNF